MKASRLGLYAAGAVVAAGIAYWLVAPSGIAPNGMDATQGSSKKKGAGKGPGAAAPVTAAVAVAADMPVVLTAPGTVEPLANVAVKARVTDAQIVEVLFNEGDLVNEGDILFRLDARLVRAQIAQAEAAIARDEASLRDAEATLARREALISKKIVTEASLDQARYAVEGLKASIAAGRALLESQRTLLDYLTIRAPISGRTGALAAKVGTTVRSADATPIVTINQTRPIWVTFALPQSELGALRRALSAGAIADIKTPGGSSRTVVQGTLAFIDNQVDKQTGTITAKVKAENTDEVLWPGLSVEVALTVELKSGMIALPAAAVLPAQQGMIVWVIGADNRVAPRSVTVERIVGQTAYLSGGIKAGERVVTDGQIRLAPGTAVTVEEPRRAPDGSPASEERLVNGRG
jgi:multidrug efflux system membrane fusion protein